MENVLKESVTRKGFLKAGLGLLAGFLIASSLTRNKTDYKNDAYGNSAYGGSKEW